MPSLAARQVEIVQAGKAVRARLDGMPGLLQEDGHSSDALVQATSTKMFTHVLGSDQTRRGGLTATPHEMRPIPAADARSARQANPARRGSRRRQEEKTYGAGKTTTMRLILGLDAPRIGHGVRRGAPVSGDSPAAANGRRAG